MKIYDAQKAKGLLIKLKYQNFSHRSQKEIYWFKKIKWYDVYEAKWKVSKLCNQVYVGGMYVYFYNWDWLLFLVLTVYDLVELIIKASH